MSSISDSNAILERKRLLPQHQAALTLIQGQLVKPSIANFVWLDLCCGKGQIIINLQDNFGEPLRKKIEYHIQDINEEYLKITQKNAKGLKFKDVICYTSDILKIKEILPSDKKYDFITLINATHEISPFFIPELILECVTKLSSSGTLYIYDMETINPFELGAITWSRDEIQELINAILEDVAIADYRPNVNRWQHSTCNAWSLEIQKEFIVEDVFMAIKEEIIKKAEIKVKDLLEQKYNICKLALDSYSLYGIETPEDEIKRSQLLFDFYSLSSILQK